MSSATHGATPYYFVPGPSRHPFMAALGLFFVILGAGQWVNGVGGGAYSLAFGLVFWLWTRVIKPLLQQFAEAAARAAAHQAAIHSGGSPPPRRRNTVESAPPCTFAAAASMSGAR